LWVWEKQTRKRKKKALEVTRKVQLVKKKKPGLSQTCGGKPRGRKTGIDLESRRDRENEKNDTKKDREISQPEPETGREWFNAPSDTKE